MVLLLLLLNISTPFLQMYMQCEHLALRRGEAQISISIIVIVKHVRPGHCIKMEMDNHSLNAKARLISSAYPGQ